MRAVLVAAFAAITLPSAPARADAEAAEAAGIDHVIVTASRQPESAFEALAPVIVIDRSEIERSLAPDVGELLRFHAGIDIAQTGGPGQTSTVFIRGANSSHTLVLVDGVRMNPGTLGVAALQNIAPELVDHIEVVKGPRSSLYGTDAIGGVINIITRAADANRLEVLAGGGRWNSREAAASGAWVGSLGSLAFGANGFETDSFPTLAGFPDDAGYHNASANLAARTELGGVALGARAWRAQGRQQYAGYDANFSLVPLSQDFVNSTFAVDAAGDVTSHWHTKAVLSRTIDDIRQREDDPYAMPVGPDYAITGRNALDWQNDIAAGAHHLTFGALLTRERTRALSFGTGFDVDTRADTGYVEDRVTLGRHRLLAAVGLTHHSTFGDHATWNAEYGFAADAATLVTLGAGTGFHAPNSTDRFGFGGNPNLKPEQARNLELGVRRRLGTTTTLAVTAYQSDVTDLINYVVLDPDSFFGLNENVDRARIRGVEASVDYASGPWLAHLEANRQDALNRADDSRLLRRSRLSATASLGLQLGRQDLGLDLLAVGDRYDVGFPAPIRLGGYLLVNGAWRVRLADGLQLQIRVENLLDKRYEYASGYNTMRRAAFAALRYRFH
jgi:vitamin B12 transporter